MTDIANTNVNVIFTDNSEEMARHVTKVLKDLQQTTAGVFSGIHKQFEEATKDFDKLGKTGEQAGHNVTSSFNSAQSAISGVVKLLGTVVSAETIRRSFNYYADIERSMERIGLATNMRADQLKSLQGEFRAIAAETGQSFDEVQKAFQEFMAVTGLSGEEARSQFKLISQAAEVMNTDVSTMSRAAGAAIHNLGVPINEVEKLLDAWAVVLPPSMIGPFAQAAPRITSYLKSIGFEGTQVGIELAAIFKNVEAALGGPRYAAAALHQMFTQIGDISSPIGVMMMQDLQKAKDAHQGIAPIMDSLANKLTAYGVFGENLAQRQIGMKALGITPEFAQTIDAWIKNTGGFRDAMLKANEAQGVVASRSKQLSDDAKAASDKLVAAMKNTGEATGHFIAAAGGLKALGWTTEMLNTWASDIERYNTGLDKAARGPAKTFDQRWGDITDELGAPSPSQRAREQYKQLGSIGGAVGGGLVGSLGGFVGLGLGATAGAVGGWRVGERYGDWALGKPGPSEEEAAKQLRERALREHGIGPRSGLDDPVKKMSDNTSATSQNTAALVALTHAVDPLGQSQARFINAAYHPDGGGGGGGRGGGGLTGNAQYPVVSQTYGGGSNAGANPMGNRMGGGQPLQLNPGESIMPPVEGGKVISVLGDARDGGARVHEGTDFGATYGSPIRGTSEGQRVTHSGLIGSKYGYGVKTIDKYGREHVYAHMAPDSPFPKVGSIVGPNDTIGHVGMSGNAAGTTPHVHYEVRPQEGAYNQALNPLQAMGGQGAPKSQQEAYQRAYDAAVAAGSPDPDTTASLMMHESGWLKHTPGNNAFGQKASSGGPAQYGSIEEGAKAHIKRWGPLYGKTPQETLDNLRRGGYNQSDPNWGPSIGSIRGRMAGSVKQSPADFSDRAKEMTKGYDKLKGTSTEFSSRSRLTGAAEEAGDSGRRMMEWYGPAYERFWKTSEGWVEEKTGMNLPLEAGLDAILPADPQRWLHDMSKKYFTNRRKFEGKGASGAPDDTPVPFFGEHMEALKQMQAMRDDLRQPVDLRVNMPRAPRQKMRESMAIQAKRINMADLNDRVAFIRSNLNGDIGPYA